MSAFPSNIRSPKDDLPEKCDKEERESYTFGPPEIKIAQNYNDWPVNKINGI
jgi:hypothetical protein